MDLTGKRVAVIGTGCSAIQVVPAIQPEVAQLDVYQRSPGWTIPKMDYAYPDWAHDLFKRFPAVRRLDRVAGCNGGRSGRVRLAAGGVDASALGAASVVLHRYLTPHHSAP